MYASEAPLGYTEHWRLVISVYPPVDTQTMTSALGGGYPGGVPFPPTSREVRLNTEKGRIEIWERRIEQAQPQRPDGLQGVAMGSIPGKPGTVTIK